MNSTQLFIENVEVELDDSVQFAITRQFEDINNPTTIINDWSKTVAIPFTKSNNELFGHIYNPDKVTIGQQVNQIDNFDWGTSYMSGLGWDEYTHSFQYENNQTHFSLTGLTVKTQKVTSGTVTVVDILANNISNLSHYSFTINVDGSFDRICFQLESSPYSPTLYFDIKDLSRGIYVIQFDITRFSAVLKNIAISNVCVAAPGVTYDDTIFSTGIHFDPYKKLDFRLEWNGDLLMTGYAKMNDIKQAGGRGTYNLTLNGQLGKLFQEMKKITFKPADAISNNYLIDGAHYVDTILNKELIKTSWESTGQSVVDVDEAGIHDIIGFAPNNSFNEDFDYKSYQVDATSARTFTDTLGTAFQRDSGFDPDTAIPDGLLPREIGEYRSYLQLPFIYFNKLFQIFQKKAEAITGYKFDLDPDWFSTNNPYWYDLVFMLKRPYDDDNVAYTNTAKSTNPTPHTYVPHPATTDQYKYGYDFAPRNPIDNWSITLDQGIEYDSSSNTFTTYEGDKNESFTINVSGAFKAILNRNLQSDTYVRITKDCGILIHYAIMMTESNYVDFGGFCLVDDESTVEVPKGFAKIIVPRQYIQNIGDEVVVKLPQTSFVLDNPNISAPFRIISYMSGIGADEKDHASLFSYLTPSNAWDAITIGKFEVDNHFASFSKTQPITYKSGSRLILNDLWDHDYNLFGEILKYCKMYRIGITTNPYTKQIKFTPLSTYFRNHTIENWTGKIDLSKDFIVTPITWDTKFVLFNYEDTDTKLGEEYKSKYGVNYGEYRLITDYNFNTDTNPLFDGIKTSMVNVDNVLSWTNLYDNHQISYSVADEPFITCRNKDKKYVDCFGQYYFHRGTHAFSTEEALNMRDVCISDDTPLQQDNNTYFYSQSTNRVRVLTYPWLDTNRPKALLSRDRIHCLFNVPKETYTITSFNSNSQVQRTNQSIYTQYWEKYINERYNIQNKKVTCYVHINPQDYTNFEFNKFIMIGDQLYFVNKIYDYDITSSESTKVDLITIQDVRGYTNE